MPMLPPSAYRLSAALLTALLSTWLFATPAAEADGAELNLPPAVKINADNRRRWHKSIAKIARRQRLDPALLHAVISVESGYQPRAVSSAGAMGLMQLMPDTADRFGVADPFEPMANVAAGARYLRLLLNKFGTIQLALAAYHAGEGRVRRARNTVPPIPATRRYINRVIHQFMRYKKAGF